MKIRRKRTALIILATVLLLLLAGTAVLIRQPSLRYRAKEALAGLMIRDTFTTVSADDLSLRPYTMEELLSLDIVTFDQSMLLINADHPLSDDLTAEVGEYKDTGVLMNPCVMDAYRSLAADVSETQNEKIFIMSAYRTVEDQAEAMAAEGDKAAGEGESEHQAGLALDVYVRYYAGMGFLDSPVGQYVNATCSRHGFIIRYPSWGTGSTGMGYEPWHLRYVGHPHAEIMTESRLTLEEYFAELDKNPLRYGDYTVMLQEGDGSHENELFLPESFTSAVISPDNRGNFVVTVKD